MSDDLNLSNSLVDLAARIKVEHEATAASMTRAVEHAMAAGDLLIEAKAQVRHGQWLPWLESNCGISERTAQLYMRVAKHRTTIEDKIRNGVADLTLNQAAALLVLTSDMQKLLVFAQQLENVTSSEELIRLCLENDVGVISTPGYNPFAGRSDAEKTEWHVFMLFLVVRHGFVPQGASLHVEWLLQRPFQNVAEWLGEEGDKFRKCWGMKPVPEMVKIEWFSFAAEHAGRTVADLEAELVAEEAHWSQVPDPKSKKKGLVWMRREGVPLAPADVG